ncbi:MAG: hypothetical protein PVSMB4_14410 [Ktedonobacterales bacterium]
MLAAPAAAYLQPLGWAPLGVALVLLLGSIIGRRRLHLAAGWERTAPVLVPARRNAFLHPFSTRIRT